MCEEILSEKEGMRPEAVETYSELGSSPILSPKYQSNQWLQQQQNTTIIARIIIQVQLSSKMWHKQLLFIMFPPWCRFERFSFAHYYNMPRRFLCDWENKNPSLKVTRLLFEAENGVSVL
jgi:hypothetical protein